MLTASRLLMIRMAAAFSVSAIGVAARAVDASPARPELSVPPNEIHVVTPDHYGFVPLAVGYRYNILPFSEEALLRDCEFTPALGGFGSPTNVYVAGPAIGIDGFAPNDFGTYNCVGRTRLGPVERTIHIVPLELSDGSFV